MFVEYFDVLEVGVVVVVYFKWGEVLKVYVIVKEGKNFIGDDVINWVKLES